jgi:molecular chaperone Hsp33
MQDHDQVCRFIIDNTSIRGQLVSLDASWQKCLENCSADDFAKNLLGQALSAVSLLASTLKLNGDITLQIRGQGAIHLLVVQVSSKRTIRGLIRQSRQVDDESSSLQEIFGADKMVITINNSENKPYQGIVPLTGYLIQHALEVYFDQSEQLPTRLWLACNNTSACGLLLQQLPVELESDMQDDDSWNRVTQLASTISDQELLELSVKDLLYRLFHEESVRLFDMEPVYFSCSCSRLRTMNIIRTLGYQEAAEILQEQGSIEIHCEFCNAQYNFDIIDVEHLFNATTGLPGNPSLH